MKEGRKEKERKSYRENENITAQKNMKVVK